MRRLLVGTLVVLLLALAALAIWRFAPGGSDFYTDADRIKEPAGEAPLRDILWQPSTELTGSLNTQHDDYEPRLSADGMTLYFVRGKAGENADIYLTRRTTSGWTEPETVAAVNSPEDDLGPEPSPDGASLYFYSNRQGSLGGYDLWVSRRSGEDWSQPVNLGPQVNSTYNDYGAALTPDGSLLYFASNRPRPGDDQTPTPGAWPATLREELFFRTYDVYAAPITERGLGAAGAIDEINTPHNEGSPCVSPWGDFLYFASDRPDGQGGFDLYRSRRLRGGHQPPANLGQAVNTPANELDPALSMGGYGLHFSSDRAREANATPQTDSATTPNGLAEAEPRRPDYNLYYTTSREVFPETEYVQRAAIDWAGLWAAILPNLLWALLALLLLLAMLALFRSAQRRKMSLLAKCLLASLAAHLLLLLLLNTWQVAASIAGEFRRGGKIQVALASPAQSSSIARQLLGNLTEVTPPSPPPQASLPRIQLTALPPQPAPLAETPIEHQPMHVTDAVYAQLNITDTEPAERLRDLLLTAAVPPQLTAFELPIPKNAQRMQARETDAFARSKPAALAVKPAELRDVVAEVPIVSAALPPQLQAQPEPIPQSLAALPEPSDRTPSTARTPTAHDLPASATTAQVAAGSPAPDLRAPIERYQPTSREEAATAPSVPVPDSAPLPVAPARNAQAAALAAVNLPPTPRAVAGDASIVPQPEAREISDSPPSQTAEIHLPASVAEVSRPTVDTRSFAVPSDTPAANAASEPAPHAPPAMRAPSAERARVSAALDVPQGDLVEIPVAHTPSRNAAESPVIADTLEIADSAPAAAPPISAVPIPNTPHAAPWALPEIRLLDAAAPAAAANRETARPKVTAPSLQVEQAAIRLAAAEPAPHYTPEPVVPASLASRDVPFARPLVNVPDHAALPNDDPAARLNLLPRAPEPTPSTLTLPVLPDELVPQRPHMQRFAEDRMEQIKEMGGSEETEEAVALALKWLAKHQAADGRWSPKSFDSGCGKCGGETDIQADNALTGLSLLCFLGAGHTHTKPGEYQDNVRRAVDWLMIQQKEDGDLRGVETMYSHGIASIALSESFAMTADSRIAQHVERAMQFIYNARSRTDGGWRYDPGQAGDTSVLGWQVMALKSAQMAGVAVPEDAFAVAKDWLERVSTRRSPGLYAYQPGTPPTASMTAEGMFTQLMLGLEPAEARQQMSVDFILQHLPDWNDDPNTYFWYYASLALFQHQGPAWQIWNQALKRELTENQRKKGAAAGSWDPVGEWAEVGSRVYQTAICTLMLEVYYRYLPLYNTDQAASLSDIPAEVVGVIRGKVRDFATGEPLPGATVRLTLPDRDALTVEADGQGGFVMFVPPVPEHFALSATMDGYVPSTVNVERRRLTGRTMNVDFALQKIGRDVLVMEAEPEVHHLGDNRFDGPINSQFQKEAEGDRFEMTFTLSPEQLPKVAARGEIVLMAKGVQRRHTLEVNDHLLDQRLDEAPEDGSFGEFTASFDIAWLQPGENKLEVIAAPSDSDIDDFEFVNVRIRVLPESGTSSGEMGASSTEIGIEQ